MLVAFILSCGERVILPYTERHLRKLQFLQSRGHKGDVFVPAPSGVSEEGQTLPRERWVPLDQIGFNLMKPMPGASVAPPAG